MLQYPLHQGLHKLVQDLNAFYKSQPALYKYQFENRGFEWIDYSDSNGSVIAFQRKGDEKTDLMIVACNFTPEVRHHYSVGVPYRGTWVEVFNSDDQKYAGSGLVNVTSIMTSPVKYHGRDYSISLTLPPLGMTVVKLERELNEFELSDVGT